jgi:hypothetical protein
MALQNVMTQRPVILIPVRILIHAGKQEPLDMPVNPVIVQAVLVMTGIFA